MTERTQEEKLLAGFAHASLIIVPLILPWFFSLAAALVIYFMYKEKSPFVAGHAKQAAGLGVIGLVMSAVFSFAVIGGLVGGVAMGSFGALFGAGVLLGVLLFLVALAYLILVIVAAVKGFSGAEFQYPLVGAMIARI